MKIKDKVFVVTGGGSGIGRALVLALLARGARVAAVDLRPEGLANFTSAVAGEWLSTHVADVSDRKRVHELPEEVIAEHGQVDAIINCAGVIQPFIDFADLSYELIERMINVNLWSQIHMIKAFFPRLKARPEAHICNVSSMGGFIPFPGQTMYGASKAAVKLLSEGIYAETLGTNVHVTVVMPGGVDTNISQNSGVPMPKGADEAAKSMKPVPAPEAARIILDGIEANRLHVLIGKDAKMLNALIRIMPEKAIRYITKQMAGLVKD
jgi:short-subunit dehydrogenase